jgi:methyl-accepting chemotaxis protein
MTYGKINKEECSEATENTQNIEPPPPQPTEESAEDVQTTQEHANDSQREEIKNPTVEKEKTDEKKTAKNFLTKEDDLSDPLIKNWVELGLIIEWISEQSSHEMDSLSEYIAEKTGDIVQNFRSISQEAKEQSKRVENIVETSTNIIIDGKSVSLVEVVGKLDGLLTDMIKDILDIARKAMDMVFVMQEVVDDSKKIHAALDDIFKITKNTKYLSVNALIEAARAGEAGKGFAIVANEVGSLSSDTENLANNMNELINGFSHKLNDGFALLEEIASKDLTPQLESKDHIDSTMRAMIEQAHAQKETLENTVVTSNNISDAVTKLIMATQFQDYAAQRIQHLIGANTITAQQIKETLEKTREHKGHENIPSELSEEDAQILLDKFSLSALKEKFLKGLKNDPETEHQDEKRTEQSAEENDNEDDIELF